MAVQVKVDFYTLAMPPGSPDFETIVKSDSESDDDESRNIEIRGFPIRLQEARFNRSVVEAEMLRIQMSDLPPKAKLSGKIDDLDLKEDEGIGGETAFLYDPATKVLVLQRNRNGVSPRMLTEYFHEKGGLNPPIELTPVIQEDALARLGTMKETRKLKVRVAGVTNPEFYKRLDGGLGEMIDVMEFFRAPSGTFELSMGHQPGSLVISKIKSLGRHLLSMVGAPDAAGEVSTMEVSGIQDDDTRDEFDVLAYRMLEVV